MIVTINDKNSDKYLSLFTEAYEYLKSFPNGNYIADTDASKTRFQNLAEYYGHMADFFDTKETKAHKFVMLPLDEDPFNIDLNTRTITVPASFSKCASVQKDQLAETIIFVADRYFDFMDLANTNIYVQWTTPEGINGATRVEMRDLETCPGKIRFAWPLNDAITKTAGNVRFSVRFFRFSEEADGKLKLHYSLNTIESTIVIKPALQPELTDDTFVEKPIDDNLFKGAVVNSSYTTTGVIPPVQPSYGEPGHNIWAGKADGSAEQMEVVEKRKVAKLENDTVTFFVQAFAPDTGELSYKWYHKAANEDYYTNCDAHKETDADGKVTDVPAFGSHKIVYLPMKPNPTSRVNGERYFTTVDGETFTEYTEEINATIAGTTQFYEAWSAYTVPADPAVVTGSYKAAATNTIKVPGGKDIPTLYPTYSDECHLPGPKDIQFVAPYLTNKAILTNSDVEDDEAYKTTLNVALAVDPYNPNVEYRWVKSTVSAEDALSKANNPNNKDYVKTTEANYTITDTPGWYTIKAVSSLNREEKTEVAYNAVGEDVVCKVTYVPEAPNVDVPDPLPGRIRLTASGVNNKTTFSIVAHTPNDSTSALDSEGLEYIWQISLGDDNTYTTLTQGYPGIVSGLGTPELTVQYNINVSLATYRCLVVNKLNGLIAAFDHSGFNRVIAEDKIKPDVIKINGEEMEVIPEIYETGASDFVFTTWI